MAKKHKRRGNGEGTIVRRKDGRYEGRTEPFINMDGKLTRKSVYGKTEAEVVAKLLQARTVLSTGGTFDADRITLTDYVDAWLRHREANIKPSTRNAYRYSLAKMRSIGALRLAKVTPHQIRQLYVNLRANEESPSAVQKLHTMLVGVFKTASADGLLTRDPMASVKRPTAAKPSFEVWTAEHLMTFLGSLDPDTTAYALYYTAAFTGMRRGELLGLHAKDVAVHANGTGTLTVHRNIVPGEDGAPAVSTPKTAASHRRITITPDVVAVLKRQAQRVERERRLLGAAWGGTEAIFPSEVGTYLGPRNTTRQFTALARRAGVPVIRLHDLRHTHASLLIARGIDPKTVSERLGHTSVAFTINTYQKLFDSQRRAAAFGMDDLLHGTTQPEVSIEDGVLEDPADPVPVARREPRDF